MTAMNTVTAVSVAGSVGFTLKSRPQQPRQAERGDEAGDETDDGQAHPPEDHAEHAAARGAERHVILISFVRSLPSGTGSLGADRGQRQRQRARCPAVPRRRARGRVREDLLHRPQLDDRQRRVLRADGLLISAPASPLADSSDHDVHVAGGGSSVRGCCSFASHSLRRSSPCSLLTSRTTPMMVNGSSSQTGEDVDALADRLELAERRRSSSVCSPAALARC